MSADPSRGLVQGGQQFKCPNCNGAMVYDAATQALKCEYCRHTMAVSAAQGASGPAAAALGQDHGPREHALREGLARAPRGLGTPMRSIQCKECGATVNLGPHDQTANCTYCASSMVMEVPNDPNLITPESLVPFKVPSKQAAEQFKSWLRGLWFRPNNLKHMAQLEQIAGVYVPFWTFDADVSSRWTAERGWYYYETETYTETENGQTVTRTREVRRTRWEPAWGSRFDHYDDVLVCGSRGMPENLVDRFSTFDTGALVHYAPGYLAGWRAESYAVDLPSAWGRAQGKIEASQQARCAGDVGGDTHRGLSVTNEYSHETFKHVLLPVYVAAYRYQGKPYRFLVNGQTGEVVGEAPYSFWKIFFLVAFILAVAFTIFLLTRDPGGTPPPPQVYPQQYPAAYPQQYPQPGYR